MVLLDGRTNNPCHTNAIAAHLHESGLTRLIEQGGLHGLGVFSAQVKDMANLNAALDTKFTFAIGARVALNDIANVGNPRRLGEVSAPVHTAEMEVLRVCTHNKVGHLSNRAVCNDLDLGGEPNRAQVARLAAKTLNNLLHACKSKTVGEPVKLAHLHLVEFMVATN